MVFCEQHYVRAGISRKYEINSLLEFSFFSQCIAPDKHDKAFFFFVNRKVLIFLGRFFTI